MEWIKGNFWIFFPFYFVGLWCGICLLLSAIGGWRRLGNRFSAEKHPPGKTHRMESARIGPVNYNNCLIVNVSLNGIYLAMWPIFRLGHPPLLIPFSEIHNPQTKKFLWSETITFEVGSPKITTIALRKKVFDEMKLP